MEKAKFDKLMEKFNEMSFHDGHIIKVKKTDKSLKITFTDGWMDELTNELEFIEYRANNKYDLITFKVINFLCDYKNYEYFLKTKIFIAPFFILMLFRSDYLKINEYCDNNS